MHGNTSLKRNTLLYFLRVVNIVFSCDGYTVTLGEGYHTAFVQLSCQFYCLTPTLMPEY